MNLIICLDDNMGFSFNNRRQSRDSAVINKIYEITENANLHLTEYSAKLFPQKENLVISPYQLQNWENKDFYFAERTIPSIEQFSKIYIFRWNRNYPADVKFEYNLSENGFSLQSSQEFIGSSHDKITLEIYERGI